MELTENEQKIIEYIRELRPFEHLEITKDREGRPDYYIIHKEQKIFLTK